MCQTYKEPGEYYGFPKCCIENFHNRNMDIGAKWFEPYEKKYPKAFKKLNYNGFIPCEAHLKELENGKNPEDLIVNRRCPLPYPKDIDWLFGKVTKNINKMVREKGVEETVSLLITLNKCIENATIHTTRPRAIHEARKGARRSKSVRGSLGAA